MRAGIYARVSVHHHNEKGLSVENQILQAEQYLRWWQEEPVEISYYIDRGYSGRTFQRPSFLRMLRESEQGRLDLIVAKDLSRLGRNYLELGRYLEQIFPDAGVRVITLGDGYDSENPDTDTLTVGLRNVMNEWYAAETGKRSGMPRSGCGRREIIWEVRRRTAIKLPIGREGGFFFPMSAILCGWRSMNCGRREKHPKK